MSICRLCVTEQKLMKSHIIPDFMFKTTGYFDEHHRLRTNTVNNIVTGEAARKLPSGEYDKDILCKNCENIIGSYETYAQKSFFLDLSKKHTNITKGVNNLTFTGLDYKMYKLFYLSILWRMSITTREAFNEVDLGTKYNEILRQMIYYGTPLEEYQFPILSSHYFYDDSMPHNLFVSPVQFDSKQYSMVLLLLNGYVHNFIVSYKLPNMFDKQYFIKKNGAVTIRELAKGEAVKTVLHFQYCK